MRQYKHRLKRLFATSLMLGLMILLVAPVAADNKSDSKSATQKALNPDISASLTQSYNADGGVQIGMIVKLKDKDPTTVTPLDNGHIKDMLGIVVPTNNAAIVLTPQSVKTQQVLVATNGHYNVLVTNQNGPIKTGDYITISALSGIGMKADENQTEVIGKAAGNFSGSNGVIGSVKLKDSLGRTSNVSIGRVPLDLNISHNPLYQKTVDYVPGFLAKVAVNVANHPVSVARIYLSTALLALTALVTGNMLYSGVRSGMLAVGRNPLSKKSIIKSLIQTVIAGLIVFVAGVFAVYLLLKL